MLFIIIEFLDLKYKLNLIRYVLMFLCSASCALHESVYYRALAESLKVCVCVSEIFADLEANHSMCSLSLMDFTKCK